MKKTAIDHPKCIKCDKLATFDSPEDLCDLHWAIWWSDGLTDDPEEKKKLQKETLETLKNQYEIIKQFNE